MDPESESANEEDFQRMWKVASTAQFVNAFKELFKFPEIEIETLEEGLMSKSMYGIHVIKNLIVALLRAASPNAGVRLDNFENFLKRVVVKIWNLEKRQEENPLQENTNFEDLEPLSKLDIVYSLCLHLLDKTSDPRSKWRDQVSKMSSDLLRVQPLGCDDEGNEYWYFYGTRLYKQEPSKDKKVKDWEEEWNTQKNSSLVKRGRGRPRKIKPRKSDGESDESEEAVADRSTYMNLGEKSRWSVVCNTLDDWVEFAEKFKDSKSKAERTLFRTLADNFLPVMNDAYQAKEKKLQQKLRELIPKPTFTRMETRQKRTKSAHMSDAENSPRSRELRLEERNRRLNQSAERDSRRRSRSRISYDESYDDFDDEPNKRRQRRLSLVENADEDFKEDAKKSSKMRESIEAKANEFVKEYASLVNNSSDNKSQVLRVFTQVKLDKNSYPFHYGIDKKDFPDYYHFITEPMDLSRMERKLRLNIYKTAAEIDDDFKTMIENCELYFGVDSERSEMARHTWRLFRRLMKELPVISKQSRTERKEHPVKEKKAEERPESGRKKRKCVNNEALDILSKEAELAVERSHSQDEEHFRNFTASTKKCTQFSDLKVESIHSHPSELIQKFMSELSDKGSEESNCEEFSSINNQNSDAPQDMLENTEENDPQEFHQSNLNSSQFRDKNDPKSFNMFSNDDAEDKEIDIPSNNCFRHQKSSDDDLNNLSDTSDILNNNTFSPNLVKESNNSEASDNNSFESYQSSNSCSPESSPKDSTHYSPQQIQTNSTFLNGYEYVNFASESESHEASTVDATCLGLASASFYKKHLETSIAQANSNNGFNELNSKTCDFSRNQPKTKDVDFCDPSLQDQFTHQEFSRGTADSTIQTTQVIEAPPSNQELSKSQLAYSYSSHQFVQGLTQESQLRHSPQQQVHHKSPELEHSQNQSRCSPISLSGEEVQGQENIVGQQNCSVFSTDQEIDNLVHSRNINSYSFGSSYQNSTITKDNLILHKEQKTESQEVKNGRIQIQRLPSPKKIESHDSSKSDESYSPNIPFSQDMQSQMCGNSETNSSTYNMHLEIQDPLSIIQGNGKSHSSHPSLSSSPEMQELESVKSKYYTQTSSLSSAKAHSPLENQQRHSFNTSYVETSQMRLLKSQTKNSKISHQNKLEESSQIRFISHQEVENNRNQPMNSLSLNTDQQLNNSQNSTKTPPLNWDQQFTGSQPRSSPTLSPHQEINNQHPMKIQTIYLPTTSANQEMDHQQLGKISPRGADALPTQQMMNKNQLRSSPNAPSKKSRKFSGTSKTIDEQESVSIQSRYSPTFSNQGVTTQESAKSLNQHMHHLSTSMLNQVPNEAPLFDPGNIFSNSLNSFNPAQVIEPPFSTHSTMQVPVSLSNQNHMARPNFPSMKVRLPPSTGELIVVPGDPSSMTFHLLAKPLSDPSQPIQSSIEINANNQMRNQEHSNNETARTHGKKHDTVQASGKQSSSIRDLEHLALNPRTSPSSVKNKTFDIASVPSHPDATKSSVIKPNAMLVQPSESIHSMQPHSLQQEPLAQPIDVQRTLPIIFPKGIRMTNSLVNSANPMSVVNANSQRPIIPNNLPNVMMQNGSEQYVFQRNIEQNVKVKNSERPPPFYPSNMMQSFPYQNGQMNPAQMLPQVHLPYINPYYIVTNPSAFQNASRYPVMNMQPISFQNR